MGPAFTVKGTRDRYRALATFGTGGHYIIRSSGIANVDFMIAKVDPRRENLRLQFRSEYFNLFNRVNLGTPNVDTTSADNIRQNPHCK